MAPSYEPEEVAYVSDLVSVDWSASLLRVVSFFVLAAGTGGLVYTAAEMGNDEASTSLIIAYVVPVAMLVALTWGALYGLTAVLRALRVVAVASRVGQLDATAD